MLGDFIYSADLHEPRYRETPRKSDKSVSADSAARRFLLLAVIFVTGGLIWIFCISPCMVPVKVEVRSFSGLGKADVLNIAGIGGGATYISINAGEMERQLARYHLVESAKVVKHFPDRLSIFLEPRRAVAMTFARINGRTQPIYFDRYGVVFKAGNEMQESHLPIISGILDDGQPVLLGMRLSSMYLPLFSRIGTINDEDPGIWQAISEIGIAKKNNALFDLVLYPRHDSIKLRMRSDINKDSIYYALLMLDVSRQFGDAVPDEIDVRSGIGVVVNAKGGHFGK
ncbi:MAG: FtsQ-type POTRA domain-containing protein [Treponema sp.]|nr:FtsQ-type POTRA domain-containing protein [Treponema sp.]